MRGALVIYNGCRVVIFSQRLKKKAKNSIPRIPAVQEVLRPRDFFFILEQEILW